MWFTKQRLIDILEDCLKQPDETDWIEFKENNAEYNQLWQRLSWLSNSACLSGKDFWFLIYWIEDWTLNLKWTDFIPEKKKEWWQPFLFKLSKDILPDNISLTVETLNYKWFNIVIFIIPAAVDQPTTFNDIAYIRIWTATPKLKDYPDKQRKIWNNIYNKNFEKQIALSWLLEDEIFEYLNTEKFLQLLNINNTDNKKEIINYLLENKIIKKSLSRYDITNLWAILFTNNLSIFDSVKWKWVRVVTYDGIDKSANNKSYDWNKWYALWFEELLKHIEILIPSFEKIVNWRRVTTNIYPSIALREFIANALIHQDFSISWVNPIIEIYKDRIEITNQWDPIIDVNRFIDIWKSRNEDLSDLMRRMKFCERLWSWIDKAIIAIEEKKLPPPKIEKWEEYIKVTLYSEEKIESLSKEDRIRACFQHCVIKYILKDYMTNSSFRERMNLTEEQRWISNKIINQAIEEWLIKVLDSENKANRYTKYVPFWH